MNMDMSRYYEHSFVDDKQRTRYVRIALKGGTMQFIVIDDETGEICDSFNGPITRMCDKNDFCTENLGDHWSHYMNPTMIYKVYYVDHKRQGFQKMDAPQNKEFGLVIGAHKRSTETIFLTAIGVL